MSPDNCAALGYALSTAGFAAGFVLTCAAGVALIAAVNRRRRRWQR